MDFRSKHCYSFAVNAASWSYELAPYIWASSMEGTQQSGTYRFHVKEPFTKLLKQLDFGSMVYASAYHNNAGVFLMAFTAKFLIQLI